MVFPVSTERIEEQSFYPFGHDVTNGEEVSKVSSEISF